MAVAEPWIVAFLDIQIMQGNVLPVWFKITQQNSYSISHLLGTVTGR